LHEIIEGFQKKWGMDFEELQKCIKEGSLKKDAYSFLLK